MQFLGCNKQIPNLLITGCVLNANKNAYVSGICGFLALVVTVFPSVPSKHTLNGNLPAMVVNVFVNYSRM
jgi:hypothetical protein